MRPKGFKSEKLRLSNINILFSAKTLSNINILFNATNDAINIVEDYASMILEFEKSNWSNRTSNINSLTNAWKITNNYCTSKSRQ